jgi:hypothetical protein
VGGSVESSPSPSPPAFFPESNPEQEIPIVDEMAMAAATQKLKFRMLFVPRLVCFEQPYGP